jgi:lysine-N-methylase
MKIVFHPEILEQQRYSCNCCGQGCRSFLVPVEPNERDSIEQLQAWREKLQVGDLFVKHRAAGSARYGLAKHHDGRCVFLGDDKLCLIHNLYGLNAKPVACQLYPFVFTPFAGELRVGLRFDCPVVCRNEGQQLSVYKNELNRLEKQIVPASAKEIEPPAISPGRKVSPKRFDATNEILLKIVNSDALPLLRRLHWLRMFLDHLTGVKWQNVTDDDFPELLSMLQGGLLAEIQHGEPQHIRITGKPRKLLGQFFFLLCHPTTIITSQKEGLITTLQKRFDKLAVMKQLAQIAGPLPKLQPHWPDADMSDLEESFGVWPTDVEKMLTRYLTCRIAGLNYCGPNFYNYSMVEGARSLLLAVVTIGWVMRIEAIKAGRDTIECADTETAVLTIDGNLGYASALATGPARLRLSYLTDHLENLLNAYCL